MDELLKFLPMVNTIVIVLTAIVAVVRVNDAVTNIRILGNSLQETVRKMDRRLTIVETVCRLNHGIIDVKEKD